VFRYKDRHPLEPVELRRQRAAGFSRPASASSQIQWGNGRLPMASSGFSLRVFVWRVRPSAYQRDLRRVVLLLSYVQSRHHRESLARHCRADHRPWTSFHLFMVTDPKTTVHSPRGQIPRRHLRRVVEMIPAV